ncbi:MAG: hypothetical protein GX231_04385 [Tissierellia bacterium]|nr:hypothetical protein [Tissierellia bacterium]
MRRRRRKRRIKRNESYFIMILFCLLVLNLGFLIYRLVTDNFTVGSIKAESHKDMVSERDVDDQGELEYKYDYIIDRLDEYESLIIIKESNGVSSIENIPPPLNLGKLTVDRSKPYILMYHTHATESFLVEDETLYHNQDTSKNMVYIGQIMTKVLEAKGHKVDHVDTLHDMPSYSKSYSRSRTTINNKKAENENLKFFLDLHRDGVAVNADYREKFLETARIEIEGVSAGTFSLVVGPDTENYEQILNLAKYIKAVSDALYPNLCTGIIIKPYGKYNLDVSNYSVLLEIGSNLVTQEEATETVKLVGEIMSLVIDSLIE